MAGSVNEANLKSHAARTKLKRGRTFHWRALDLTRKVAGLSRAHIGYQRSPGESEGRWVLRTYRDGKYAIKPLGPADDARDADGATVLSYEQAAEAGRKYVGAPSGPQQGLTVRAACESYVEFLRAHKKTANDARDRLAKWVLPLLGDRPVGELTKGEIERCHAAMVRKDKDDPEVERRSKDSANRVLTSLKAALNRAFADESNGIPTDTAWRRVKPFEKVGRARQVHLDVAQSNRLINVCEGAFRRLVTAALLTGARAPHELASLYVRDFRPDLATLSINGGKTGARDIVLTQEAVRWFQEISAGRAPDELLLPREDGSAWTKSVHARDMIAAVAKAKLPKGTTIYSLRHTYASQSLLAGMNIKLLAENMGTSIRMIEVHYGKFIAAARRKLVEESAFRLGLKAQKVTPFRTGAPRL